jgi:hypothetical protein
MFSDEVHARFRLIIGGGLRQTGLGTLRRDDEAPAFHWNRKSQGSPSVNVFGLIYLYKGYGAQSRDSS